MKTLVRLVDQSLNKNDDWYINIDQAVNLYSKTVGNYSFEYFVEMSNGITHKISRREFNHIRSLFAVPLMK